MPNRIEQELGESKMLLEGIQLPAEEVIYEHIRSGIRQAKMKQHRRLTRWRRGIWYGAAACGLILLLAVTVRVSPVFASVLRDIPGMKVFVKLVQKTSDQGIKLAVENEFLQPVGVSDTNGGLTFTVDGILVDNSRLVAFYSIRSTDNKKIVLNRPDVLDPAGNHLQASVSWGSPEELKEGKQEKGVQRGTLDIQLADGSTMPDEVVLQANFNEAAKPVEQRSGDNDPHLAEGMLPITTSILNGLALEVRIPIDKTRFANLKREYAINKSIEAGGQKINVVRATVDPLRIAVEMTYDEANSKQIFDPVDIHLTDDKGAEWRYIGGSAVETNRDIIYFESSYFHAPKELYLEGTLFRALDKNRLSVVINTESKQLLNSPDDKLTLKDIQKTDRNTRITLALKGHSEKDRMGYNFLDPKFKDAEGRGHEMNNNGEVVTWSSSSGSFEEQNSYYYLKNETYPQPLTFQINAYPAYLEASYRIRIQ